MAVTLRKRISLPLVINGCVSSLVLLLGMSPTLGAFTASITGSTNTSGAGTIVMQELDSRGAIVCMSTDGGGIDLNSATCSGTNNYGGGQGMRPGDAAVVTGSIQNAGSVSASSFSLTPGACVQSASGGSSGTATDFCSKVLVKISSGSYTIFSGTAESLGGAGPIDVLARIGLMKFQPGQLMAFTVTTTVDPAVDNSYEGLTVSQPLTWTFSA